MDDKQLFEILSSNNDRETTIRDRIIKGEVLVTPPSSKSSLYVETCEFENGLHVQQHFGGLNIHFKRCKFEGNAMLSQGLGSIVFEDCTLNQGLELRSATSLRINNCKLKQKIELSGTFGAIAILGTEFMSHDEADCFLFKDSNCRQFTISDSTLVNASFKGTVFQKGSRFSANFYCSNESISTDFSGARFDEDVNFMPSNFEKRLNFASAIFQGTANFNSINSAFSSNCDFTSAEFKKRVDFDGSSWIQAKFNYAEFNDFISFKNSRINYLCLTKANVNGKSDFIGATIKDGDRETFRIIKNEFIKINNGVEALRYKSKEMASYERELRGLNSEYFLVFLNRISNNHGINWGRGVLFTLIAAVLFFILYLCTLGSLPFHVGYKNWHSFTAALDLTTRYFVRFLIITHDIDFMSQYGPTAASFVVDFVAKIFIGFGIYQTIAAFRKHGKS